MTKKPKILLLGRYLSEVKETLQQHDFVVVNNNPDLILCYGGDGTLLGAERAYPTIPKFPIRDHYAAQLCEKHQLEQQLDALARGELTHKELIKIGGFVGSKHLTGINDIFIHTENRVSALRYRIEINDELYAEEIIGDGVGLATPYGSTAYYRSITGSIFRVGLGLAFSNSTEQVNHMVLPDTCEVKITITRGTGIMLCDNAPDQLRIEQGETAILRKTPQTAYMVGLDAFMCPECRRLRHSRKREFVSGITFNDDVASTDF